MPDTPNKKIIFYLLGQSADLFKKALLVKGIPVWVSQVSLEPGDIVKKLAELAGGKGGGRPNLAQAGTKSPEKIGEALAAVERVFLHYF